MFLLLEGADIPTGQQHAEFTVHRVEVGRGEQLFQQLPLRNRQRARRQVWPDLHAERLEGELRPPAEIIEDVKA